MHGSEPPESNATIFEAFSRTSALVISDIMLEGRRPRSSGRTMKY
jgi:hypothetical protein